jgi:hypothetical protein
MASAAFFTRPAAVWDKIKKRRQKCLRFSVEWGTALAGECSRVRYSSKVSNATIVPQLGSS